MPSGGGADEVPPNCAKAEPHRKPAATIAALVAVINRLVILDSLVAVI
jgi:hypothetical protein